MSNFESASDDEEQDMLVEFVSDLAKGVITVKEMVTTQITTEKSPEDLEKTKGEILVEIEKLVKSVERVQKVKVTTFHQEEILARCNATLDRMKEVALEGMMRIVFPGAKKE